MLYTVSIIFSQQILDDKLLLAVTGGIKKVILVVYSD